MKSITELQLPLLVAFLAALATYDLATSRIPNRLTVPIAFIGLAIHAFSGGMSGFLASLGGTLVPVPMLAPMYLGRGLGAGDVKAVMAVGAFLGPLGAFWATVWTLFFGGIGGIALLISQGRASTILSAHRRTPKPQSLPALAGSLESVRAPQCRPISTAFPYGVAIAFGTATSLLWLQYHAN